MLRKPKSKQKSVAERVAELINHPNQSGSDSESESEATAPRVVDYDEDEYQMPEAGTTEFRKRNVKLLSEQSSKYKGKIASRKDFEEEYEESDEEQYSDGGDEENEKETSDSDGNDEALKAFGNALRKTQNGKRAENSEVDDSNEESKDEQEDDSENGEDDVSDAEGDDDDAEEDESTADDDGESDAEEDEDNADEEETEVLSKVNHEAEIQKGVCVQNQLRLWERLLELRINSQKFLSKANQLPPPNALKELNNGSDKQKAILQETTKQTQNLLNNLVSLQNALYSQYSEVNTSMKNSLKRPLPFKEHHNGEPPLKQMNVHLQERFETFRSYRNTVLLKWDDRTKLLTPGAGAKKKSMDEDYDIIRKIDNALMNKSMLIQKSQQMKSAQQIKNDSNAETLEDLTENCNVYDDTDFYHQQLRELIEYKANTSNNMSEVTRQFLELQKLRQKMKKKVDTRASKGRKLRYVVHNKLINFMAPHDNSTWTDESKEELCKSLFV